jgi:hypothetical protein
MRHKPAADGKSVSIAAGHQHWQFRVGQFDPLCNGHGTPMHGVEPVRGGITRNAAGTTDARDESVLVAKYERFKLTESGISPISHLGIVGGNYLAAGIEHNELGQPTASGEMRARMTDVARHCGELKSCASSLGQRATAFLNIGTEQKTIRGVAHECGVDYWRLRQDLKYFMRGGLKQMIEHSPRADILTVEGVQKAFFDWCNSEYDLTGNAPSGQRPRNFWNPRIPKSGCRGARSTRIWRNGERPVGFRRESTDRR